MPPIPLPLPVQAYHNVNGTTHQQEFDQLSKTGYRMISLSVYNTPANPLYAAVWVQRPGPSFVAFHGQNAAFYQDFYSTWSAKGYVPTHLTITGPSSSPVFAAVFEQIPVGSYAKHGLDLAAFQNECRNADSNGFILLTAAVYGDDSNPTFAGVWADNAGNTRWTCHAFETAANYQTWFNVLTQIPARPAHVVPSHGQHYLAIFRDDSVGNWSASHGLTTADYQAMFDQQKANGCYPISVQAGGEGSGIRFAAVFARQDQPAARQWQVAGTSSTKTPPFDQLFKTFMQAYGVRAGSLAAGRGGKVELARAYTWAEAGYPTTQTSSVFRLASVSKAFTCAAITTLINEKKLSLTDKVFPLLNITAKALAAQLPDPHINDITVDELVRHAGGWVDHSSKTWTTPKPVSGFDPVFQLRAIGNALQTGANSPTKRDLGRYMYGEPLQFSPGTQDFGSTGGASYSNFGYVLLGLLVEKASGQSYANFVIQKVLAPLGITDVHLALTLAGQRLPGEVTYLSMDPLGGGGATVENPSSSALLPTPYGGSFMTETMDSGGGLGATASALVQFLNSFAAWGLNGRAPGAARTGGMPGTSSRIESRTDGVDYAFVFNCSDQLSLPADPANPTGPTRLDKIATDINTLINSAGL